MRRDANALQKHHICIIRMVQVVAITGITGRLPIGHFLESVVNKVIAER